MGFIPFNDIDYKVKGIKTQLKNNTWNLSMFYFLT
jgi:hypothetical protein